MNDRPVTGRQRELEIDHVRQNQPHDHETVDGPQDDSLHASPLAEAMKLAELAAECGLDGVVCSAHEAAAIRDRLGSRFLRITPGIRLPDDRAGDQKRVMTPLLAVECGASYLVIGRSVTRAPDPLAVLARINREIAVPEGRQ